MTKSRSLFTYMRSVAVSCLGLTPYSTTEEVRAAVLAQLHLATTEAVFELDSASTEDPILARKIAAAQLLLCPQDGGRQSHWALAFSVCDTRVPAHRRVWQEQPAAAAGEQLSLAL